MRCVQYVSFDLAVAKALRRLSALPKLRELQFRYNNLHSLHQVRALAARIPTSVTRLTVKNNAVTKSPLFKLYVAHAMPVRDADCVVRCACFSHGLFCCARSTWLNSTARC